MPDANELMEMSSAVSSGFVADRALLALVIHGPADLTKEERATIRTSGEILESLFLVDPADLVSQGKVGYLTSAQTDWYEDLAAEESTEPLDKESAQRFRAVVSDAVSAAYALAEDKPFKKDSVKGLERLLSGLSRVTREHTSLMRARMRPRGRACQRQTIVE